METYTKLFDKICLFENLHLAYLKARMSKRYRKYVLEFTYNLEHNLLELQHELISQTYRHGSYREFIICGNRLSIKRNYCRKEIIRYKI